MRVDLADLLEIRNRSRTTYSVSLDLFLELEPQHSYYVTSYIENLTSLCALTIASTTPVLMAAAIRDFLHRIVISSHSIGVTMVLLQIIFSISL